MDNQWKLENISLILELIDAEIEKYGKENEGRKIKRHYYNSIKSLYDIHDALIKTYENEKEAFWHHFLVLYPKDLQKMKMEKDNAM